MADIKIVGAKGLGGGKSKNCEPQDNACDCSVDHKTIGGNGSEECPFEVIALPGAQPFAVATKVIYARPDGSNRRGNGTLDKPYRTFQRAVRDVPLIVEPGVTYIIDITGIDETLPETYTLPAWKAPNISTFGALPAPYSDNLFLGGPINIAAIPRTVPLVPASDAVITLADVTVGDGSGSVADPISGLRTITLNVARPSLAAGATVAGKFLLSPGFGAVIDSVDPTGTVLTYADRFPPSFPITISEPSAHLHGTGFPSSLNVLNVDCVAFQGLKLSSDVGAFGVFADGIGCTQFLFCELPTPYVGSICPGVVFSQANRVAFCWLTGSPEINGEALVASCFADALDESFQPLFNTPGFPAIISTAFRGCAPIRSVAYAPQVGVFRPSSVDNFLVSHCLIAGGTGSGIEFYGSCGTVRHTNILGCAGDAISADQGSGILNLEFVGSTAPAPVSGTGDSFTFALGVVTLFDAAGLFTQAMVGSVVIISGSTSPGNDGTFVVTSVGGGGTSLTYNNPDGVTEVFPGPWTVAPNGGYGIQVNDGMDVRVDLDTSTTLPTALTPLTGADGDMKVGTLAARTWLDFRTIAPIKNEYDLSTPFVVASSGVAQPPGDELTGAGTGGRSGSRLFERV